MDVQEINLNADASQFAITKIEEQRAFNYYKEKLLPEDVKQFNLEVAYLANFTRNYSTGVVTVKDVTDNMRKVKHRPAGGIVGGQIKYVAEVPQKHDNKPVYFTLELHREKVGVITLKHWHTLGKIELRTELQENMDQRGATIDDYRISPKEEAEALAYIKRYIVEEVVEFFDSNKASYGRRHNDVVDPSKVARSLKKHEHWHAGERGNPNDEADYIAYSGYDSSEDFWPPTTFEFVISKDHDEYGWIFLKAGYKNPFRKSHIIYTMVKKTKYYPSLQRENYGLVDVHISKQEEQQALQFIRTKLLIGPLEKVGKLLKKTNVCRPQGCDLVQYSAWVDGTWHGYHIQKQNNKLTVTRLTNGSAEGQSRFGPSKWIVKEGKFHRRQQMVSIPLLSKREKDEAFYHLKMIVAPKAVQEYNNYMIGTKGKDVPQLNVPDILKKLRKVSDDGNKVTYQSDIDKTHAITLFIEKKNTDFVIHTFGKATVYIGFLSTQMGFPHQWPVHPKPTLEENEAPLVGSPHLEKREIHQAMDFIKKQIIPCAVRTYNERKDREDTTITPEQVSKVLKITYMRDAKYGSSVFLHSVIGNYDFKFCIAKRRNHGITGTRRPYKLTAGFALPTQVRDADHKNNYWFWMDGNVARFSDIGSTSII